MVELSCVRCSRRVATEPGCGHAYWLLDPGSGEPLRFGERSEARAAGRDEALSRSRPSHPWRYALFEVVVTPLPASAGPFSLSG